MRSSRYEGFTLIELLTVMSIIAVLAGILLTALSTARLKAKRARARAEIAQVVTAWTTYLNDYRRFPSVAITNMGADAIAILRGANTPQGRAENPTKTIYMDFRAGTRYFCDPWGSTNSGNGTYNVSLDAAGQNEVTVGGEKIPVSVAVWSNGPDGVNDKGKKDDIVSWRR